MMTWGTIAILMLVFAFLVWLSKTETPPVSTKQNQHNNSPSDVRCPACCSTAVSANKKGYRLLKGGAGMLVAGPLGLVAGFMGSGVKITCLNCGKQWEP